MGHCLLYVTLISKAKVRSDKFVCLLFGFVIEVFASYIYMSSNSCIGSKSPMVVRNLVFYDKKLS